MDIAFLIVLFVIAVIGWTLLMVLPWLVILGVAIFFGLKVAFVVLLVYIVSLFILKAREPIE